MKVAFQAECKLFGVVKRQGRWYIAYCPPLDLTTQGRAEAEAKKNLVEPSQLFIISCLEGGTFDQALKELGFVPVTSKAESIPPDAFPMAIPIPFRLKKALRCRV